MANRTIFLTGRLGRPMRGAIDAFAGDTLTLAVDIVDDDGAAVTVTGYTAAFAIGADADASADVTKATGGSGITISGDTVTVTLAAADTVDLDPGAYHFELELTDGSSLVSTVLWGRFTIRGSLA